MTPTLETAVLALAVSHVLAPLVRGLFERRATKHEAAADQVPLLDQRLRAVEQRESAADKVPLLVQRMEAVAADVREIKTDLRMVVEHDSKLQLQEQRLKALESWVSSARAQLHQVSNHVQLLMGEHNARRLQHAANVVASKDAGRSGQ
ncbi:hypothetical protein JY651_28685 [Pyxidicoccus parkwayensis]|uniref:Uncharacterized protein n=1 Tax=Pyxidicoccus parkwayensis TaxID=2813578 RepID=A0ABX7NPD5_9BACT|nr:hypothetical protein [Pyxidicoccus parkwaysis]QSQ19309.1 hypothetical protein JY651_28685 [Pyxidicoccus parkwaysis]